MMTWKSQMTEIVLQQEKLKKMAPNKKDGLVKDHQKVFLEMKKIWILNHKRWRQKKEARLLRRKPSSIIKKCH